jgi:hypothetical protein
MSQIDKDTFSFSATDYNERWESYYFRWKISKDSPIDPRLLGFRPMEWLRSDYSFTG